MTIRSLLRTVPLLVLLALGATGCHRRARAVMFVPTGTPTAGGQAVTVSHRHYLNLIGLAARDLACNPAAVAGTEVSPGIFSVQGCGALRDYVMVCRGRGRCRWVGIEPVEAVAQRELQCGAGPYQISMPAPLARQVAACGQSADYALACSPAACAWTRGATAGVVVQSEPGTSVVVVSGEGAADAASERDVAGADVVQISAAEALQGVLAARILAIRQCAAGQPLQLRIEWAADGAVTAALAGPLAGTPTEQCVQQAVGPLSVGGVSSPGEFSFQL